MTGTGTNNRRLGLEFGAMLALLFVLLSLLFHGVWLPGHTLFSNDGPLGRLASACHHFPERFTGCWADLNGLGFSGGDAPPGISVGLQYLLKPVWFSKLYAIISLTILGLGAWCFFSQLRMTKAACLLGGLAAALNSCFFSVACWGVAAQATTIGLTFFAMAAMMNTSGRLRWLRVSLAGFAVGMGVVEGADVGAILSIFVAAFVAYKAWLAGGPMTTRVVTASTQLILIVVCSMFIAAQAISSLVATSISGMVVKGVVSADEDQQTTKTKQARWDWATQWSLPVPETAGLVFPGLFGYRLDTPHGGAYWGNIGQDPSVTRYLDNGERGPTPKGFMRYSGGGFYAGIFVALVAVWTILQSFRKKESVFSLNQRQWIWFWLALIVISLPLAFGRFAPFYQFVYDLPYFNTIRNPIKFIYLVSLALVVLFGYGIDAIIRRYLTSPEKAPVSRLAPAVKVTAPAPGWSWEKLGKWEKSWLYGCGAVLALVLLGWIQYASAYQSLVDYLHLVQFKESAESIANFSIRQVGWFVLFFIVSAGLLAAYFGGAFLGKNAKWGVLAAGALLVVDLGRADLPWIVFWDYNYKYSSNQVIERLRTEPYKERITFLPGTIPAELPNLNRVYRLEWLQQQFPYYDIQTLDIVDMPRKPQDFASYMTAPSLFTNVSSHVSYLKLWRLTNARYLLGMASDLDVWNRDIPDPNQKLRILERFDLEVKPGKTASTELDDWTVAPKTNGVFALFEYTGSLPRAMLFANWQTQTNEHAELLQLFSPDFDPHQTVLMTNTLPATAAVAGPPKANYGKVDFASYAPKDIVLKSDAPAASVLLLNDRFDPDWNVQVDGKPQTMLHCNYIMRGVYLEPGKHTIEFRYQPPFGYLYVSLAGIGCALLVLALVLIVPDTTKLPEPEISRPDANEDLKENVREAARETPAKVTQKSPSSSPPKRPSRASARR